MSDSQLNGPDLSLGIAEAEVPDGALIGGHSGGESVVLVRRGKEYFAIGGTCTHYSGPLAEGIVTGNSIRCPWHHACFDLRTGEPVRAPALAAVPVWNVERTGGLILVRQKANSQEPRTADGPGSVTNLGAGPAGVAVADTLRREGYRGKVALISRDPDLPYDKPNLSKDYLAGKAPEDWIPLHSREYYQEKQIDLLLGREVAEIDSKTRSLVFADGNRLSFDVLVMANGAEVRRLDVPGANLPHVHYLRTFADSRALVTASTKAGQAVVIGSSFIGLEVAASLRARKVETTVVGADRIPLERVLGAQLGNFVKKLHESNGVSFRLERSISAITASEVILDDGERLLADLVVIGIGVAPNVKLAQTAGMAIDGGIAVNEFLETSFPGIFAAGDLARWPDPHSGERIRVEHWVVASRQGQTVARNILGRRERFEAVPFFWSAHYDVVINYVGHAAGTDTIEIDGSIENRDATVTFRRGGRIAAVATIFRDRVSLEAEVAMERSRSVAPAAAEQPQ